MGDRHNSMEQGEEYRWRPAVVPYRPVAVRPMKHRKSAPGQMLLPGLESAEPDSRAECPVPSAARLEMTCPNCGGTEFDDEGDCTRCWEPGVARGGGRPPF